MKKIVSLEVARDLTAESRCDKGFLRLSRLMLRHVYEDGSRSSEYPCDIVSRPHPDAAAVLLYERTTDGRVMVVLKKGMRPPVYFRRQNPKLSPDLFPYFSLVEMIAGILEPQDHGEDGVRRRAAAEALEEAGHEVSLDAVRELGAPAFASPGITDEKIFFCAARIGSTTPTGRPEGDGSLMEEGTEVVVLELAEAIAQCRRGEIADMKTELSLYRLADALGYLPQLGAFASELPEPWRARHQRLGLAPEVQH